MGANAPSTVEVYVPVVAEQACEHKLAPRLPSLAGRTVGLLNNTKDLADVLLDEVRCQLESAHPGATFRSLRKLSVNGAGPALLAELATCDAVVTAVGD